MSVPLDTRQAVHVARQPILDANRHVFGYELLYREAALDGACVAAGDVAGSRVLTDALLGIGLDTLTDRTVAFVNFTRAMVVGGAATLLPTRGVVIELREDIAVDQELIEALRELRHQGYLFALDDYVPGSAADALLPYASFVKLDVLESSLWRTCARHLRTPHRRVVAERVERSEVAIEAQRAGCSLFQGYYFCRPSTHSARALPAYRQSYLNLFAALNRPDLSIASLEELVKRDLSLTMRVLRSINSAAYAIEGSITSVRQALVLLGVQQVRQWAAVWAMAGLSAGAPHELVAITLVRARMCELIGRRRGGDELAGELFLLGMCSTLDVVLEQPMESVLSHLPVGAKICEALLGGTGEWRALLDAVIARERGYFAALPEMLETLHISETQLSDAYVDALKWAHDLNTRSAA
jgi:c-di-GMP phosphodiesterase